MVVQHNMQAMNANRMLGITAGSQAKSTEKLSSGYKINRAADDAAGLTISEKMRKQIRGLDRAATNAEDGVSAVQTAEGALTEVHDMLQRMNELATQAANGTNSESDRQAIQAEIDQLVTEIDRVAETTKFNETYLLKGDGSDTTKTIAAHDAGLKGKLTDNGDGTSSFVMEKPLAVGDKVTIAGTEYTIGKSKEADDYVKKADTAAGQAHTPDAAGDSVTSGGNTTSIVAKVTTADAVGATWAANDTFTDAEGKEWKVIANSGTTDEDKGEVKILDVGKYLTAGSKITANADNSLLDGTEVVDELAASEISITDTAGITAMQGSVKVGDTVTVDGTSKNVTAEDPKTIAEIKDLVAAAGNGKKVAVGSTEYELGIATDETAKTITQDDFLALVKDGSKVKIDGNSYTAIATADVNDSKTITIDEAYGKIAEELTKASSIGTDTAATVKNAGSGNFTITQGTVTVKDGISFNLHVGADADMTNKINVNIDSMSAAGLGIKGINVMDETGADATYAIDAISDAIATVSSQRSALGAVQNRLEHTIANLDNVVENTTSAESRIRDTDMAEEMVNYSKNSILQQAGQSMLAQANQANQGVLSLLS